MGDEPRFSRTFLNDCLIAASAGEHGFVLVTRNLRDFETIQRVEPGVEHVPPWPSEPYDMSVSCPLAGGAAGSRRGPVDWSLRPLWPESSLSS